ATMSSGNLPFGFSPLEGGDPDQPGGGDDLTGKIPLFNELQRLLSWSGGPVNWNLAKQISISALAAEHRAVSPDERRAVDEAVRLGDLWLNQATDLPSGIRETQAWTRVEWIERTQPVWAALCDPVAARVVNAMSSALPEQIKSTGFATGPMAGVMSQFGGLLFGAQVGQGLAEMAKEVVSSTDIGLPLGPSGVAVVLPENMAAFGSGLERPDEEIRLYLALREAAHHRLFGHVPWLRQRLLDAVESYARGIVVDMSALERAMTDIDPTNPESVQQALSGGLFEQENTPEQTAALRRLETLLALVEGWVDTVVSAAATDRMPGAAALREALRRRRAAGGPAEETFSTLVGLELRPRRLREAATLWWAVTEKHGITGRDGVWAHPDLLPDADDLDDPIGFAQKLGADPLAELPEAEAPPRADDPTAANKQVEAGRQPHASERPEVAERHDAAKQPDANDPSDADQASNSEEPPPSSGTPSS
ncbi:MAG: zinc-dependent metalloprotease, partial [Chloroflexi bacterium]|nr:zinc-dependent metalloprotease [Chloroflexota bacterium]